jgi:hypothetical protein
MTAPKLEPLAVAPQSERPRLLAREVAPEPTESWTRLRQRMEFEISAAYSQLGQSRADSFEIWHKVRLKYRDEVRRVHKDAGFENTPLMEEVLWDRCAPTVPASDPLVHVNFLRAMLTPATRLFQAHCVYRYNKGGNVMGQIQGPTGLTKSSIALGFAEWFAQTTPARQMELLVYHPWTFPDVYAQAKAPEVVISDENVEASGEGSRTLKQTMTMMEQQTRKSQVSSLAVSPEGSERGAQQFTLEVILVDWGGKRTRCILWYNDHPLGFVELPWCSEEMWKHYTPWKDANVERSKGAYFNDQKALFRMLNDLCDRPEFQMFVKNLNKPKKQDLEAAVRVSWGRFMPDSQLGTLVNLMYTVAYGWDRWRADFEHFCGEPAADGLQALAVRCYKE